MTDPDNNHTEPDDVDPFDPEAWQQLADDFADLANQITDRVIPAMLRTTAALSELFTAILADADLKLEVKRPEAGQ